MANKPNLGETTQSTTEPADKGRLGHLPVVGLGASAGGLAALRQFFTHMPANSGLAFVVVIHLAPEHESHLAEILQRETAMPVSQVNRITPIEHNHVYVISPNTNLATIDAQLRLTPLEADRRARAPIDHFFRALATTHGAQAIGIVLSGTGADGALGLRRIKETGGLTIAQEPGDAEHDQMPRNAIAIANVDLVLPVTAMPSGLLAYLQHIRDLPSPQAGEPLAADTHELLQQIRSLLSAHAGNDFAGYHTFTLLQRIRHRMWIHDIEDLAEYLHLLGNNSTEVEALLKDLLIPMTYFFQDPPAYAALAQTVIPKLFHSKGSADQVRIWITGCGTGEEAYSLAILLLEYASNLGNPPALRIFATDLHQEALARARQGLYPETIAADVSEERLGRFFIRESGGYRVKKEVRDLILFARHDLFTDPPFAKLDLIVCRNLLASLEQDVQRQLIDLFHYALLTGGWLFLGLSEAIEGSALFSAEDKQHHFYQWQPVETRTMLRPLWPIALPATPREPPTMSHRQLHARMLEHYAPPSVLVDANFKIVHRSAGAGRYLVHPSEPPAGELLQCVRPELQAELGAALNRAFKQREATHSAPVVLLLDGEPRHVRLEVWPSAEPELAGLALVFFLEDQQQTRTRLDEQDAGDPPKPVDPPGVAWPAIESHPAMTGEARSSTVEALQTANEELQVINEELSVTLDELETSREELQSINEEFNQENENRLEELNQLNADLQNFLNATRLAILFLDRALCIRRFTPVAAELFNLVATDLGRPLADITHKLIGKSWRTDATQVLKTLVPLEREVTSQDGRCYLMRITPYRTGEDRIDGVVITFVDITSRKQTEQALVRRAKQQETIAALGVRALEGGGLDDLFGEMAIQVCQALGAGMCKVLELLPDGETLLLRAGVGWQEGKIGSATVLAKDNSQAGYTLTENGPVVVEDLRKETRFHAPPLLVEHKVISGMTVVIQGRQCPYGVLGVHSTQLWTFTPDDINFLQAAANLLAQAILRKQVEEAQRKSETQLRLIINNLPALIAYVNAEERYVFANSAHEAWFGLEPAAIEGRSLVEVIGEAAYSQAQPHIQTVLAGHPVVFENDFLHQDGTLHTAIVSYAPHVEPDGRVTGFYLFRTDITEQKRAEKRFRQVIEHSPNGIVMVDAESKMMLVNAQVEAAFGYQRDELLGRSIDVLVPQSLRNAHAAYRHDYLAHPSARPMGTDRDLFGLRKDGSEFAVEVGLAPIESDQGILVLGTIVDVSARKDAERKQALLLQEVARQHTLLRTLNKALAAAQERERQELARELHDRLGQNLTALGLSLKVIQSHVAKVLPADNPVYNYIEDTRTLAGQMTEQIRDVMADLRPPMLGEYGLLPALKWFATQFTRRTGLTISVQGDELRPRLAEEVELHVFRIAQEALNNVTKHAQATQATMVLIDAGEQVLLTLSDNGRGMVDIDTDSKSESLGWGLLTMRERALAIGGRFWLESEPDRGTTVYVEVTR